MVSLPKNRSNFRNMGLFFVLPAHYEMHLLAAIKSNETHSREEKKYHLQKEQAGTMNRSKW